MQMLGINLVCDSMLAVEFEHEPTRPALTIGTVLIGSAFSATPWTLLLYGCGVSSPIIWMLVPLSAFCSGIAVTILAAN